MYRFRKSRVCSFKQFVYKAFLLFVTCLPISIKSELVTWRLDSNPAVFYSKVYLLCAISDNSTGCRNSLKQWLGGKHYGSLCYDSECRDGRKYSIMQEHCTYTLVIHTFTIDDLNCEYTCSYGASNMRKNLTALTGTFVYYPEKNETLTESTMKAGHLQIKLYLKRVYPVPKCYASVGAKNITGKTANETQIIFFKKVTFSWSLAVSSCMEHAPIYCTFPMNVTKEIELDHPHTHCKGENQTSVHSGSKNEPFEKWSLVIIGVSTGAVIFCFCTGLFCYRHRKRKKKKRPIREKTTIQANTEILLEEVREKRKKEDKSKFLSNT